MHVWTCTYVLSGVTLREAGRRDGGLVSLDEGEVAADRIHSVSGGSVKLSAVIRVASDDGSEDERKGGQ